MSNSSNPARSHFTRHAWGVLIFALGLVFLSAAQLAYRFALPTDGWAVLTTENFDAPDWVYWENLVGAPSGLRRDDIVTAVNTRSIQGLASNAYVPPPPGWAANQTVEMRVVRQDQPSVGHSMPFGAT
jgi:hypothetical protein